VRLALDGRLKEARAIHYRLLPLMNVNMIDTNPVPVKAGLAIMGHMDEQYRLPLVPLSKDARQHVQAVIEELGLVDQKVKR
jgi:4-hydroxy-tetrahydrodipicolinate synthase